jgi:oxygen-independent coproporphyrinogen-3 oxidase
MLEEHGFEHYEISNFGKPGFFSQHNSAYWFQKPYLGIGPSAHSFKGNIRSWNIANNPGYIKALETEKPFSKQENLSSKDQFNELLLTRLRTKWGVSKMELQDVDGSLYEEFKVNADLWINKGMLTDTGSHLTLAKQGVFIADAVISDMFVI